MAALISTWSDLVATVPIHRRVLAMAAVVLMIPVLSLVTPESPALAQQIPELAQAPSSVAWGSMSACDENRNRTLDATVTNQSGSSADYRILMLESAVGEVRHQSHDQAVGVGQAGPVVLGGIPEGTWFFRVTENGADLEPPITLTREFCPAGPPPTPTVTPTPFPPAPAGQYESRVLSIRYVPGADGRVEYTGDIATPVDDIERDVLIAQMNTAEDTIMESLRIGSRSQLDVQRVRALQYNERPPQSDQLAFGPGTPPRPDYPGILTSGITGEVGDFCSYIVNNGIDMIFMWTNHLDLTQPVDAGAFIEPTESAMSFPGGDLNIANHASDRPWLPPCRHTYIVYNFNLTRTSEASVHIIMHQIENYLGYCCGTYLADETQLRGRKQIDKKLFDWAASANTPVDETTHYTFDEWVHPRDGVQIEDPPHDVYVNKGSWATECGDSHWAPNIERHPDHPGNVAEYNYRTTTGVSTSCMDWNPQGTGTQTVVSCATWDGCAGDEESVRNYERWWLQQLPGTNPANPIFYDHTDGQRYQIRNFWQLFSDFDSVAGNATDDARFTDVLSYMVDFDAPVVEGAGGVYPAVSCLAGNGRFDMNLVNTLSGAATFRIEFEGLTARQLTVDAGDWWRMPFTGRADRSYDVVVKRNGSIIFDDSINVSCDTAPPQVGETEVQIISACRSGLGYILFQFVNPSATSRSYVITFEGVNNRSTTAAAYGGALRAVTGRTSGTYTATVKPQGQPVQSFEVVVDC